MPVDDLVDRLTGAPLIAVAGLCRGAGASTVAAAVAAGLEGAVGLADVGGGGPRLLLRGGGRSGDAELPIPADLDPSAAVEQLRRAGARQVVLAGPLRTLARPAYALGARAILACGACCAPAGMPFADHLCDALAPFQLPAPHALESQLQAKAEHHGLPVLLRARTTPRFASTPAIPGQETQLAREATRAQAGTIALPGELTDALARAMAGPRNIFLLTVVAGDASQMRASAASQRALADARRLVLARPLDVVGLATNPTGGSTPLSPSDAISAALGAAPHLPVADVVAGL